MANIYGYFRDEMKAGHDYYDVIRWFFFFFFLDLIIPYIYDFFFLTDQMSLGLFIPAEDFLCYFIIFIFPFFLISHYLRENGYAAINGLALYIVLIGWIPLLISELLYDDILIFFTFSSFFIDYFFFEEEEEIEDEYEEF
jgi:hypothetical protein